MSETVAIGNQHDLIDRTSRFPLVLYRISAAHVVLDLREGANMNDDLHTLDVDITNPAGIEFIDLEIFLNL